MIKLLPILILGISTNAFCCLMATQERIIPIGTSENCLIGIEIISNRYGEGEYGEKAVWDHKFTLKGFNEDYSAFLIKELHFEKGIENDKNEHLLKVQFNEALQICDNLDHFELLKPKEISFCDFQRKCSKLHLIETDDQLKFQINNKNEFYPIRYLNSEYNGEIAKPYKEYFEFYFENAITGTDLKISSVREYENSFYKLLVFHLGTGQEFKEVNTDKFPSKKEVKFDKELRTIKDAIFIEPILHHGKGFDYFIMNKK